MEDQPIGAHGNQQHRGHVAEPCHQEKRPGRQPQIEGQHIVGPRADDLVEQGPCLNRDDEQEDERREYVDEALQFRPDIGVNEVDRDVRAAVRRGGDAPEDQDAQEEPSEVVAVRNLDAEEVSQQDRGEDIGSDDADEERSQQLDPIDEAVHVAAPDHDLRSRLGCGHVGISHSSNRRVRR